jgi:tetratricopeptide (TPR) repeat protein
MKKSNSYFTWKNFADNFQNEVNGSRDVHTKMLNSGVKENSYTKMDFTFISDQKENLASLGDFIKLHYPYSLSEINRHEDLWEIRGETNEIPITSENLLYWVIDMYKRGHEFDAKLDAYGGLYNPDKQILPDLSLEKESFYFDKALVCYENGDLSGSIIYWSLTLEINPEDVNSYYSRAIVKNELHRWKAALNDYNRALARTPKFTAALLNRGDLKDENGDYQGAIEDYEKILSFDHIDSEDKQSAYYNLGNTMLNLKNKELACLNWNKALEFGADYAMARIEKHCI